MINQKDEEKKASMNDLRKSTSDDCASHSGIIREENSLLDFDADITYNGKKKYPGIVRANDNPDLQAEKGTSI